MTNEDEIEAPLRIKTINAIIRTAEIRHNNEGTGSAEFSIFLRLTIDGGERMFCSPSLSFTDCGDIVFRIAHIGIWITEILRVAGVNSWHKLPGTPVRVNVKGLDISAIGHYLEEEWFETDETAVLAEKNIEDWGVTKCPE